MEDTSKLRDMQRLAYEHLHANRIEDALATFDGCLSLYDRDARQTKTYADICNFYAAAAVSIDRFAQAESLFQDARAVYAALGCTENIADVDFNLSSVYRGMNNLDESDDRARAALHAYQALGIHRRVAATLETLCHNQLNRNALDEARALLGRLDELSPQALDDLEVRWSRSTLLGRLAALEGRAGDADAALAEAAAIAHVIAEQHGDPRYVSDTRQIQSNLRRGTREPESAHEPRKPPELPPLEGRLPGSAIDWVDLRGAAGRTHIIQVASNDIRIIVCVEGDPGTTQIDAAAPDLLEQIDRHGHFNHPEAAEQWKISAVSCLRAGERQDDLSKAYIHYRLALFVAMRLGDLTGVSFVTNSIWMLSEVLRDICERGKGPRHDPQRHAEQRKLAELLGHTSEQIRSDANSVAAAAWKLTSVSADDAKRQGRTLACHRLACMAGNHELRRAALDALIQHSSERGDGSAPLIAAAETLTQLGLEDLIALAGSWDGATRPMAQFLDIWPRYQELRASLLEASDLSHLLPAIRGAFQHMCHLRLRVTTAGGSFGHEISRELSTLMQDVGRDLVGLYRRIGDDINALLVAECIIARSMADWLTRNHGIWKLPPEFGAIISGLQGSINASAVAGLAEIRDATRAADAPLLYYLRQRDQYVVWLVRKDGRIVASDIENPKRRLAHVLPSITSGEGNDLDQALRDLYDTLLPAALHDALADQGKRLVVISDPGMQSIPFCALRSPDNRYLIEKHETLFWPSVTSWLNLEAGRKKSPAERARLAQGFAPLVMGTSNAERKYSLRTSSQGEILLAFVPLENVDLEAEQVAQLLGAKAVPPRDATEKALFERGAGTDIIHIAAHAYINEAYPGESFVALASGNLTADDLYRSTLGIHTNLVVLSACQSGLGGQHGDSVVGLANAFHIAGASSVVSTIWPISDEVTPAFMAEFYGGIKAGQDLATALCAAQRALLAKSYEPLFWATFRLSGCTENPVSKTTPK